MRGESLFIGYDADEQRILLGPKDQRAHLLCSGSSGSGKSRAIEHCLREFLRTSQPFILIDPEGTLAEAVTDYAAHHVLDREIIELNFSDPASQIIPYNPFKRRLDTELSVQVDQCTRAILHAWNQENAESTPTLRRVLPMIFHVLIRHNLGLKQALHLIDPEAGAIREHLIEDLQSPLIEKEWRALEALKRGERRQETLSTINRLMPFLNSEALTRFMSVPERSLDWNDVFNRGASVIVNIAESGSFSEEAGRMAGALVVNDIYRAALRRQPDEFGEDPEPMYRVVIDEFQELVSIDILKSLDRSRKRSVFFWLLHQRFGQLGADFDANLADAAITNCRIKVVMGGLPVKTARRLAEELFIAELDPKKIKFAVFQTKFWPVYRRDKVYSRSESNAVVSGVMESIGHGSLITDGSSYFNPGNDWFGMGVPAGTNVLATTGSSNISVRGGSNSNAHGVTESEADIPTIFPVPFRELSSLQTYSIDEQLWELTAALKEQYTRHAFVKIHDQKTQPMLAPFVKRLYTPPKNREWYVNRLFEKQEALTVEEADRLIEEADERLRVAAEQGDGCESGVDDESEEEFFE